MEELTFEAFVAKHEAEGLLQTSGQPQQRAGCNAGIAFRGSDSMQSLSHQTSGRLVEQQPAPTPAAGQGL